MPNILVTGGAGFIGTHLVRHLIQQGQNVTVLDNFSRQIHAGKKELAPDIRDHVHLVEGDVRDLCLLNKVLHNKDVVVHLAAETGTGQSMYEVGRYQDINVGGAAALMDCLVNQQRHKVQKVVLASSRAVYGEGQHRCTEHGTVYPRARSLEQLQKGEFEPICPVCKVPTAPEPTREDSPLNPLSFYALTKQFQEQIVLMFAHTLKISASVLRYQNVYGPGQSLENPYTGILAVFANLASSECEINVFEDGYESRDFIFVKDVVEATWRCIATDREVIEILNVGTGYQTAVLQVAKQVAEYYGSPIPIRISRAFRAGDIRHGFADMTKTRERLGFEPQVPFAKGISEFLDWARNQQLLGPRSEAQYRLSLHEMRERGLLHG
jgi:dTDP-L-rhamnose 4-epimerase